MAANLTADGAVSEAQRYLARSLKRGRAMFQKVTTVILIGTALALAACNTVRGAARDVNSVANCTENAINGTKTC
jgi:predicted small secreted protein